MIAVRAAYYDDRDGRDVWCPECFRDSGSTQLVTVDAILIIDLHGVVVDEHSREGGVREWIASTA